MNSKADRYTHYCNSIFLHLKIKDIKTRIKYENEQLQISSFEYYEIRVKRIKQFIS